MRAIRFRTVAANPQSLAPPYHGRFQNAHHCQQPLGCRRRRGGLYAVQRALAHLRLAAGLCGVAGMLPDIDSDSGRPLHESLAFAAAVVPMMLLHRLRHWEVPHELLILAGAGAYLLVRLGWGSC